jgi:hypothetical protein
MISIRSYKETDWPEVRAIIEPVFNVKQRIIQAQKNSQKKAILKKRGMPCRNVRLSWPSTTPGASNLMNNRQAASLCFIIWGGKLLCNVR